VVPAGFPKKDTVIPNGVPINRDGMRNLPQLPQVIGLDYLSKKVFATLYYLSPISASATGYYGTLTSEMIFNEEDPPANDFLGKTCRFWKEAAD